MWRPPKPDPIGPMQGKFAQRGQQKVNSIAKNLRFCNKHLIEEIFIR
jgi:hypothetical protein